MRATNPSTVLRGVYLAYCEGRWDMLGAVVGCRRGAVALLVIIPSIATVSVLKTSDNPPQFSIFDVTLFPFPAAQCKPVRTLATSIMKLLDYGARLFQLERLSNA